MNLHEDKTVFIELIRATSGHYKIKSEFIEKDYWLTFVLRQLANSNYLQNAVFKGGTSLSKAYKLIDRFSEDIDIAIISESSDSGNNVKNLLRSVEKEITQGFIDFHLEGVTSKGSRYRKSVIQFQSSLDSTILDKLIIEVNAFANPFPFKQMELSSLVFSFLTFSKNLDYVRLYNLHPFKLNVLSLDQTLIEKMVSLIRFSFDKNPVESLSKKIRHFYDIYFLCSHMDCIKLFESNTIKIRFNKLWEHDLALFDEPDGWKEKLVIDSPLLTDFDGVWNQLKSRYKLELTALAYNSIPPAELIATNFKTLLSRIR